MTVYEMEGFLRGKCLPGDMKVNESNAQYLVRKLSELQSQNADMAVQLANAESKCRELAAENAGLKAAISSVNKTAEECEVNGDELKYVVEMSEFEALADLLEELPATDAFLAEVRASELDSLAGVAETMLVKFSNQRCSSDMHEVVGWKMVLQQASNRAAQLRKGAAL